MQSAAKQRVLTSPSVQLIVQSVPARRTLRERLLVDLPGALVVEDANEVDPNPWRGYRSCLRAVDPEASHALIIQDDAVVCRNFLPAVDLVASALPGNPVCLFFSGRGLKTTARLARRKDNGRFFPLNRADFMPVVAVLWPVRLAEDVLDWSESAEIPGMPNPISDDAVCGSWMRHRKVDVFVTIPSLVEHPDDVDPVKGGHQKAGNGADRGRVAYAFCTGDPLDLHWSL